MKDKWNAMKAYIGRNFDEYMKGEPLQQALHDNSDCQQMPYKGSAGEDAMAGLSPQCLAR